MIGAAHLMMRGASGPVQPKGLFAAGYNAGGELGLGDKTARSSPVQVGSGTNWTYVASHRAPNGDANSLAVKSNGSLWALGGWNYSGELGLGDRTVRSSPVQVGSLLDWANVEIGMASGSSGQYAQLCFAIKTDGSLWAWGDNQEGGLALSVATYSFSSPTQVGALKDWKQVAASCGGRAIKTDGSLWVWGYNAYGELGLSDRTLRSSPIQVGSALDWKSVAGSCAGRTTVAIKTGGTLWVWGYNAYGELGLGDRTSRSSPVQIGSDTNWAEAVCGEGYMLAIKTNGTLWSWGRNEIGTLGLGDRTSRSSPVQVGSDTNWTKVRAGCYSASNGIHALKTNGTLWAWGGNVFGALGLGDTAHRSSPVQVGSGTNWTILMSKNQPTADNAFAIRT
jgi:alpha-tubulin suppressor-like RCC1 family protein